MIRVLHIISGSDNGGASTHLLNLCGYSKCKFKNIIGCIGNGPLYKKAVDRNLDVILFKTGSKGLKHILDYIKKESIDIVNFHGPKSNLIHFILKQKINCKCVTTVHSDYRYDFLNNKLKYLFFTPLSAMALKSFDNYICVSNSIKRLLDLKGFSGLKQVINNAISINNFKSFKSREEIRSMYHISSNDFVFVMVARMHPIKNHIGLINAFSKLKDEFANIKLLLVGDGQLEGSLKKKVTQMGLDKDIIFTGFQNNPLDYVNASEVSVLTSFNEGLPLTVLESGMMRKPIICSSVGILPEIVNNNRGFLINPNSVDDIFCKMKQAYLNKQDLSELGENLYNFVKDNYTIDKFCDEYFTFYQTVLESSLVNNTV